MDARQPFYHRNADVDEMSFQVSGERTLMTELGTVELRPGDFSRIPVGVAHDNYGRKEVHLLFYVVAPAMEVGTVSLQSTIKNVPFPGWKKASPAAVEMMTECLGAGGCDIGVSMADEDLLVNPRGLDSGSPEGATGSLLVQRPNLNVISGDQPKVEWLYKSAQTWIGNVQLDKAEGRVYHRHRCAHAIQCQVKGSRTLITQRGTIEMQPGDHIAIPKGCAYTNICSGRSQHVVVLCSEEISCKMDYSKEAKVTTLEKVEAARRAVTQ
jgi:uncharacterized cupin superfamily protein